MITGIEILSAKTKALIMADIVLSHRIGDEALAMGSREWDSLTEMGDGKEVVAEFVRLYFADPNLQTAVRANDRYIGIEHLIKKTAPAEPPLSDMFKWIKWYRDIHNAGLVDSKTAYDARAENTVGNDNKRQPAIVIYTEEGIVQHVTGTIPANVTVIDYAVSEEDDKECLYTAFDGTEVYLKVFKTNPELMRRLDRDIIEESNRRAAK
ncbi:MAG: hypothetical protein M0036_18975 [Desulfobacteraceae bacterium]|nr:hypothetical protein [Desulfobacteraceae bacterium]